MEKLKQNRTASFIAVALVYIIAAVAGVLVYRALDLAWWLSLLIADAVATVATFLFSLLFQNASVYDPYWSVQPPVILAAVALRRTIESSSALRIGFFTDRLSQKENHPKGWASVGRLSLRSKASRLATRSQAAVALRRTTEPSSALRIGFFTDRLSQKENHPKGWFSFWRRGRDSNPRVIAHKLISSPFGNLEVIEQCYLNPALF